MKVLYGVQATGNGHLSRCMEFYPRMCQHAEVDLLMSGIQGDLQIDFPIKHKFHGLSFIFGKAGGVDYLGTAAGLRPIRLLRDIMSLDVSEYDLIVSDFEPISAWAARYRGVPSVGLSHQAAFLSELVPRPDERNEAVEQLYRWFAPTDRAIGLHYEKYDINIEPPVIRSEIRQLQMNHSERDVLVYLPAYGDEVLLSLLEPMDDYRWHIFSKHSEGYYERGHVSVYPVGAPEWTDMLCRCPYAIIGGGFQGPAEMMYLGKKLLVVPMHDQYEQLCNTAALEQLGVTVVYDLKPDQTSGYIANWLNIAEPVKINFPDVTDQIIRRVLDI